jgi:signal transduction histidine kinase
LLIFGAVSLLGNEFGTLLRYPEIGAALFYPPYAILTATLVLSPRRDWPSYILVSVFTHVLPHVAQWPLSWVLLADVANLARALVATVMLRWLFGDRPRLDGIRELMLFIGSAVLIAPAVGATIGAANVVLHGGSATYWRPWSAWFMSNALTGLTMLPMFLIAIPAGAASLRRARRRRVAEALLLALALACTVVVLMHTTSPWAPALPLYAPLPALIWAALRFGVGGASLALTAVAVAAVWSVDRGGLFVLSSPVDSVLALQLFVLLTTIPVLCIAAVASARYGAVRLYRALLASLQDHVAILDARGIVLEINNSWRLTADTADVQRFHRVGPGDDYLAACRAAAERGDADAARALAGIQSVLGRGQRRFEMEYDREPGGGREWWVMSVEALERLEGGAVVTRANVSARRRAHLEIEEQRRELSHLARVAVLGQLSGALAHELSQPLTSILANAEAAQHLLRRQPADLHDLSEILQDILTEDRRAGQVVHRLRALLKRGEMRLQRVDAGELVREVLELARGELITRRVTAATSVDRDLPAVLADRVQLQQVLLNLILNASEAMSATAPAERTLLLTVRAASLRDVQVSVRDCGTGIPPALIERLFEPFVTTKPEGLGLGLSISKTIVSAHGGRLWAENNPDRGATVHCLLPSAPTETIATPADEGAHEPASAVGD